jgi:hypothetical protein
MTDMTPVIISRIADAEGTILTNDAALHGLTIKSVGDAEGRILGQVHDSEARLHSNTGVLTSQILESTCELEKGIGDSRAHIIEKIGDTESRLLNNTAVLNAGLLKATCDIERDIKDAECNILSDLGKVDAHLTSEINSNQRGLMSEFCETRADIHKTSNIEVAAIKDAECRVNASVKDAECNVTAIVKDGDCEILKEIKESECDLSRDVKDSEITTLNSGRKVQSEVIKTREQLLKDICDLDAHLGDKTARYGERNFKATKESEKSLSKAILHNDIRSIKEFARTNANIALNSLEQCKMENKLMKNIESTKMAVALTEKELRVAGLKTQLSIENKITKNTFKLEKQAAENKEKLKLQSIKNTCKLEKQAAENFNASQLLAIQNKCEISKQLSDGFCEVKERIDCRTAETNELIKRLEIEKLREQLEFAKQEALIARLCGCGSGCYGGSSGNGNGNGNGNRS